MNFRGRDWTIVQVGSEEATLTAELRNEGNPRG
jgi:hypothetical protein